jgi:hypothetical protein
MSGRPFVGAIAATYFVEDHQMHYGFDWADPTWTSENQTITHVQYNTNAHGGGNRTHEATSEKPVASVTVRGTLAMRQTESGESSRRTRKRPRRIVHVPYEFTLSVHSHEQEYVRLMTSLDMEIHVSLSTHFVHTFVIHESHPDEAVYGFGERFTYPDLKHACVPILAQEQGVGRGQQPFTFFMNRFQNYQGTYARMYVLVSV